MDIFIHNHELMCLRIILLDLMDMMSDICLISHLHNQFNIEIYINHFHDMLILDNYFDMFV